MRRMIESRWWLVPNGLGVVNWVEKKVRKNGWRFSLYKDSVSLVVIVDSFWFRQEETSNFNSLKILEGFCFRLEPKTWGHIFTFSLFTQLEYQFQRKKTPTNLSSNLASLHFEAFKTLTDERQKQMTSCVKDRQNLPGKEIEDLTSIPPLFVASSFVDDLISVINPSVT